MNKNSDIRVRFGDLISELSKNCNNIEYSIITTMGDSGSKSLKQIINKYNLDSTYQRMIVSIKGDNKFKYRFFLPFTVADMDAHKGLLLEHLDVNVANNGKKNSIYSTVVVNKDVENVMLNLDNTILNRCEDINFYPADMFKSIINNNNHVKKIVKRK